MNDDISKFYPSEPLDAEPQAEHNAPAEKRGGGDPPLAGNTADYYGRNSNNTNNNSQNYGNNSSGGQNFNSPFGNLFGGNNNGNNNMLSTLLPMLMNGGNADMGSLLSAMTGMGGLGNMGNVSGMNNGGGTADNQLLNTLASAMNMNKKSEPKTPPIKTSAFCNADEYIFD